MADERTDVPYVGEERRAPLTRWLARQRVRRVADFLEGDVLELGCGFGGVLEYASVHGSIGSYTGVEALAENVEVLGAKYPQHKFYAFDLDCEHWPVSGTFDCILALAVVEHLWNLKGFFSHLRSLLKDDGVAVCTTPTIWGNHVVLRMLARLGLVREDVIADHVAIFGRPLWSHVCDEFGFRLESFSRFQFGGNQLVVLKRSGV